MFCKRHSDRLSKLLWATVMGVNDVIDTYGLKGGTYHKGKANMLHRHYRPIL